MLRRRYAKEGAKRLPSLGHVEDQQPFRGEFPLYHRAMLPEDFQAMAALGASPNNGALDNHETCLMNAFHAQGRS